MAHELGKAPWPGIIADAAQMAEGGYGVGSHDAVVAAGDAVPAQNPICEAGIGPEVLDTSIMELVGGNRRPVTGE